MSWITIPRAGNHAASKAAAWSIVGGDQLKFPLFQPRFTVTTSVGDGSRRVVDSSG